MSDTRKYRWPHVSDFEQVEKMARAAAAKDPKLTVDTSEGPLSTWTIALARADGPGLELWFDPATGKLTGWDGSGDL